MALTKKQRIAVARDVLKWIPFLHVSDISGYFDVDRQYASDKTYDLKKDILPTIKNGSQCYVCARGAFFIASVDRWNKCNIKTGPLGIIDGNSIAENRTIDMFGEHQSGLIEAAFEPMRFTQSTRDLRDFYPDLHDAARLFARSYYLPNKRLRAIAKNIIRNKGEFIIPRRFMREIRAKKRRQESAFPSY